MIMKKLKVICIICARGGSKGLKNKNLRKISNKPLIFYPINMAKKSKVIDEIVVSTDSTTIANVAKKFGAKVPFIRPKEISGDLSTTEETLRHAILETEKLYKVKYDIGVFLTATDIFRKIIWIKQAVKILKNNNKIDSVFSGHSTHKNFWEFERGKWKRLKPWMKKYSSRQVKRKIVREDTGIVCATRTNFWRRGHRLGPRVQILTNDYSFTGFDIHDINDLKIANYAFKLWKI